MNEGITVFVVDDDPAARESVAALVKSKGLPVETFESAEDFLARMDFSRAGCLIVDVKMTGMSGLGLQRRLKEQGVALPVVVITGFAQIPMAVQAIQNGAVTFMEKPCKKEELWRSIDLALRQDTIQRETLKQRESIQGRLEQLTKDELLVLDELFRGQPNKRIAAKLDIGLRPVELRRSKIMKKMQADSLAELVRLVMTIDYLPPDSED